MELHFSAFEDHAPIPLRYTGDGQDLSPALSWTHPPASTQAFALIVDDPDAPAGLWVHWVLYDLPASAQGLAEGQAKSPSLAGGALQGRNSWGRLGYNGPAPPPGRPHRYFFKLHALSAPTGLPAGATKSELEKAIEGKTLAEAQWVGTYRR